MRPLHLAAVVPCVGLRGGSLPKRARQAVLHRTASSLGALLEPVDPLREALGATPDALGRVVSAPQTFGVLCDWERGARTNSCTRAWLGAHIAAEACLAGTPHAKDGPLWTAARDVRIGGEEGDYQAPRVAGRVVDFCSPAVEEPPRTKEDRPWRGGRPRPVPSSLRADVLSALEAAFALLDRVPEASDLVRSSVVEVRVQADGGAWFTSSSSNREPGRVTLHNPQLPDVDSLELANALLHEAVHSLLYSVEQDAPLTSVAPDADTARWTSPWTQSPLTAHGLTHASHVWWCLLTFWTHVAELGTASTRDRARLLAGRAAKGFRGPELSATLHAMSAFLTPQGRRALATLAELGARSTGNLSCA